MGHRNTSSPVRKGPYLGRILGSYETHRKQRDVDSPELENGDLDFFFHLRKTNMSFFQRMYIDFVWNGHDSGQTTVVP